MWYNGFVMISDKFQEITYYAKKLRKENET